MNQNYYDPNLCYNSNSFGFDQYQPLQYSVIHQPPQEKSMAELLLEEKLPQALQALCESSQYWKPPIYYDNDDNEEYSIQVSEFVKKSLITITLVLLTIEPEDSLGMRDERLSTIPENECDMPVCDDSSSKNDGLDDIVSIPMGKEIDHLDAIPDSVQSLLNRANSIIFLIEEFTDELAPIDPIPPGIIPDAIIIFFSPSPILVEDNDSLMKEINIFLASDDSIPSGIENDDYDSEGDVLFLEELLNDDSISLPGELYVYVPNVLPTLPTLYPMFDTLLPLSSKNEDKVFNPGILISKEEKSPHLLSHHGFKVFSLIDDSESLMVIYGGVIPILDVPYLHFYPP
ncbi:hypothetical protein Tco_0619793 [Tanacetum coccineum]